MSVNRLLIGALLVVAGCASTPPSFSDALGAGYATVDTLARTTAELCGAPLYEGGACVGSISTDVRDDVADRLRLALDLLDEARQHQADGSADLAQQRIAQARAILRVVSKLTEVEA